MQCGKVEWKWKWSRLQGSAVQYVKFLVLSLLGFFFFPFFLAPSQTLMIDRGRRLH